MAVELVHRENAERLHSFRPLQRFADDARALICCLKAVAAQARHVQQHVGLTVVGDDEPEPLGDVEPFDDAADLHDGLSFVNELGRNGEGNSEHILLSVLWVLQPRPFRAHTIRAHAPRARIIQAPLVGRLNESHKKE